MKVFKVGSSKILVIGNFDRSSEIVRGQSNINHVIGGSSQLEKFWDVIKPALTNYVTVQTETTTISCGKGRINIQHDFIDWEE